MDHIKNTADVKQFFCYLYEERKVAFHPDETFESYVSWANDKPTFTQKECEKYNRLMDECFDVCDKAKIDIYELACDLNKRIMA